MIRYLSNDKKVFIGTFIEEQSGRLFDQHTSM